MPRQARLDYPGALHHVIVRGIERRAVFLDARDRWLFLHRLGRELKRGDARCFAWALLPNHMHLLLRTGRSPLPIVMQRLLTGYAVVFNLRHDRSGHLFQNRYRSIVCEEERYFLELVRYIHLNPVRAGLVRGLGELNAYPWTSHSVILGNREFPRQDVESVLGHFGGTPTAAKRSYMDFLSSGLGEERREDLEGGGVVRSLGGRKAYFEGRRKGVEVRGDDRVLGSEAFGRTVIEQSGIEERRRHRMARRTTPAAVIARAGKVTGVAAGSVKGVSKKPERVRARSLACKWLVEDMGMRGVSVAKVLGLTPAAVSKCVERGRSIEAALGAKFGES